MQAEVRSRKPAMVRLLKTDADYHTVDVSGEVSDLDFLVGFQHVKLSPDFDPDRNMLIDLSGASPLGLGHSALRAVRAMLDSAENASSGPRTAVVGPTDSLFDFARKYAGLPRATSREVRAFRDREAAVEWLTS
jgi:hypothetical protein